MRNKPDDELRTWLYDVLGELIESGEVAVSSLMDGRSLNAKQIRLACDTGHSLLLTVYSPHDVKLLGRMREHVMLWQRGILMNEELADFLEDSWDSLHAIADGWKDEFHGLILQFRFTAEKMYEEVGPVAADREAEPDPAYIAHQMALSLVAPPAVSY